jgi:hypothetical protein
MKLALSISAALLLVLSQSNSASAQSPTDLVQRAVNAQGGAEALRALKSLVIKGDGRQWVTGQAYRAAGEPRFVGESMFTVTADLAERRIRVDWDRELRLPTPSRGQFSEIVLPTFGIVVQGNETRPMSGIRLATHQREYGRGSPLLLLKALTAPQNVTALPDQKLGDRTLPAVSFKDGVTTYVILFDHATHLPAAVRTRDDDHLFGDSDYEVILADWKAVAGGAKLAHELSFRINGTEVQQLAYREIAVNAPIEAARFAVSDEIKAKARAAATEGVPYQWVIGRLMLGRFVDSDAIYFPPGGSFRLSELAPNVQQVLGGSANNLIVAMKDGIVIFDAPVNDGQSRWVMDAAKAKYPGKPIKYLVLTHHHNDHSGGMRAYVAEGATVIVPSQSKAFFEHAAKAPRTIAPDALQRQMRPATIVDVKDSMTLKDETVEINLHNIANPHANGFLIGHIVKENIVWIVDLVSPRPNIQRTPWSAAAGAALRKHGIKDALIAGGHGTTGKQADLKAVLAAD